MLTLHPSSFPIRLVVKTRASVREEFEYLFLKLNFRESQLAAIRELYYKYFEPITENFQYLGYIK
jgi:hypothetical protein